MRNIIGYSALIYFFALLQTVLLPEFFALLGSPIAGLTIDFFLLLILYFSFNRDFFHGLVWIVILSIAESGLGYVWEGVQVPVLLLVFVIVQGLKVQFVFQSYASIRMVVFALCMLEHSFHIYFGTGTERVFHQFGYILLSCVLHASLAPYLFDLLTRFDAKTIYRFEKQRTLFTTPIRSL
ncbi:MAG: hypothetical protein KDK51_01335 [Deltaproteobacteria bacterium]|nr:hypothetical protein [Deltaproteobacteria bacterium]